jgi:dienelactone hydrolase
MRYQLVTRTVINVSILSLFILCSNVLMAQSTRVQFMTTDKVPVTADLYANKPATAPLIILFHQANYSKGEFLEIAPRLNELGFNCLAVDLRSGGAINGIENKTYRYADSLGMQTRFIDTYADMRAAVAYVKRTYPGVKIILFGSSFSGSLSIKFASDFPDGISGVVAFSPSDNFSKFGWSRDIITTSASRVKCPVFIASAAEEKDQWQNIFQAIPVQSKVAYTPETGGIHGSKTLWKAFPESPQYWQALKTFLARF